MHQVHAGLVGLGVHQLEQRGHPEPDGAPRVSALRAAAANEKERVTLSAEREGWGGKQSRL